MQSGLSAVIKKAPVPENTHDSHTLTNQHGIQRDSDSSSASYGVSKERRGSDEAGEEDRTRGDGEEDIEGESGSDGVVLKGEGDDVNDDTDTLRYDDDSDESPKSGGTIGKLPIGASPISKLPNGM